MIAPMMLDLSIRFSARALEGSTPTSDRPDALAPPSGPRRPAPCVPRASIVPPAPPTPVPSVRAADRRQRGAHGETPVILMTGFGYDPNHSIVRSSQEGLSCFLFKPFQATQLVEEVRKALGTPA